MCGIFGAYSLNGDLLPSLEMAVAWTQHADRGMDAAGYLLNPEDGETPWWALKAKGPSADLTRSLVDALEAHPARWLMTHTRHATKGHEDNNENNHPLFFGDIALIHNGVIHNDDEVFKGLGTERTAAVDSIAIAAALHAGGLPEVLAKVKGNMSIAWVNKRSPRTLHLYTNGGSPLWVDMGPERFIFASQSKLVPLGLISGNEGSGGVPKGIHVIVNRKGVSFDKVGVGVTLDKTWVTNYQPGHGGPVHAMGQGQAWRQNEPNFERRWHAEGGTYDCYSDACIRGHSGQYHTHVAPVYGAHSDHFHNSVAEYLTQMGGDRVAVIDQEIASA
jgi:asparagine synthetase B (glutamine-hydrolysing)